MLTAHLFQTYPRHCGVLAGWTGEKLRVSDTFTDLYPKV